MDYHVSFLTPQSLSPFAKKSRLQTASISLSKHVPSVAVAASNSPLLQRVARGERASRPPIWLLRQAGRYMKEFRAYSDTIPFRRRSEDPKIARELSLQPWRAFHMDAVIMFSDILTPLPAVGIEFDIVRGKGPCFEHPIRSLEQALCLQGASFDPRASLPFIEDLLRRLRSDLEESPDTTLIGFAGAPFTLAAYAIEGSTVKHVAQTKRMMFSGDKEKESALELTLDALTRLVADYAIFQIDAGAQVIQLFESWAHHLTPAQYAKYALPYARRAFQRIKAERPDIPVIFFANGTAGKLELIRGALDEHVDVFAMDWTVSMRDARSLFGKKKTLQGNVDPALLLTASKESIRDAVRSCVADAQPGPHILNIGHGIIKETPEEAVAAFCDAARECNYDDMHIENQAQHLVAAPGPTTHS